MKVIEASDPKVIKNMASDTGAFRHFTQELIQKTADKTIVLFGALENGRYVGRICLKISEADELLVREKLPGVPQFMALQVNKDARKKGVGTMLCNAVFERAKQLGHKQLCLGVEPDNKAARALYEKCGFEYEGSNYEACWDEPDRDGGLNRVCVNSLLMVKQL